MQHFVFRHTLAKIKDYLQFVSELELDNRDGKLIVTKEITKEVLPDVTAQIFWLRNRQSEKWGDKKNVNDESGIVDNWIDNITEDGGME